MPAHQARAIQMSLLTGCCVNRSRIALTMEVTGWCSAKARTGPGIVPVGTNAELMNGTGRLSKFALRRRQTDPEVGARIDRLDRSRLGHLVVICRRLGEEGRLK